ncbi:unnamed protein product [Symbiodinium sp. CCMP2592]|nr:unnamed protein product [Symbiodinium sp. CCMP2592]
MADSGVGGWNRLRLRNTFLEVTSEEDVLRASVKWSRFSSWPCGESDAPEQRGESVHCFDAGMQVPPSSPSSSIVETDFTASTTSTAHSSSGECNPCIFFASSAGCHKHESCSFCHLHPARKDGPARRARKQTRDKYKSQVMQLFAGNHEDMQSQQEKLQKLAKGNWYVRAYILACLNGHEMIADGCINGIPEEDRRGILEPGPVQRIAE